MFSGTQQKCKACEKTVYVVDELSADGVVYHKYCFKCSHCKGTLKLSNYCSMEGILYCKPHFEQLFKETGSYNKSFQQSMKSSEQSTPTNPKLTSSPIKADDWIPEVRPELTNSPATLSAVTAEMVTPELTNSPATLSAVTAEMVTPEPTRPPRKVEKPTPELSRSFSKAEKLTPELSRSFSKAEKLTPELTRSPSKAAGMFLGTQEKCATCGKTAYPLEKVTVEGQSYHKTCFKCFHGGCSLSPSNYAALEGIIYCKPHFSQLFKEKGSYNHLIKCASIKRG